MALPNTAQLTSQLAKMPDQALKQMAMMHKNDPYTLPLIIAEDGRRKELRQSALMAQTQPLSKVVDQDIAAIGPLPEQQGIGQLPAPNVAHMADGGIAGYGDDQSNEQLQYNNEPVLRMANGGVAHYAGNNPGPYGQVAGMGGVSAIPYYLPGPSSERDRLNALPGQWWDAATGAIGRGWDRFTAGTTIEQQRNAKAQAQAQAETAALAPKYDAATQAKGEEILRNMPVGNTTGVDTAGGNTSGNTPPPPPPPPGAGLPSLASYDKKLADVVYKNAPKKEDFMKESADIDKPFIEAAQANIDKEGKRLESDREQDMYMSMIIGGAKAAAGTSPYALQNIAEGIAAGGANYKDALKEFRKATQENTKAELALKQYEATGKKDALKSYYSAQEKRDDRYAAGITQIMTQQMQTQGQMAVAGMPGAQERLFTSLADPKSAAYKGFKNYAETMGPEARGDTTIRAAAINKWSSEPMLRQEFNNDFDSYLRMMSGQKQLSGATEKQLEYLKLYAPKGG